MQSDAIYKQKEGIASRRLGADLMLYDPQNDKVHILNESGALVWELLSGENSFLDIKKKFVRRFPDTQPEQISADINEVIQRLLSEELILPVYEERGIS